MSFRIPPVVKWAGLALVVLSAFAVVLARTKDLKRWVMSQWGVPHGAGGRLFAWAMPMSMKEIHDTFGAYARLRPDDGLLDVACGSGAFLASGADHVSRVAGLDISDVQVGMARRRLRERIAAGTAEIYKGDAASLPWVDGTFTVVTCLLGLEFFADPEAALREMERVLRPGGRIVATFGIDETDEPCVRECDWWGWEHLPEADVRKMVEDAGFAAVSISYPDLAYRARFLQGVKPS